MKLPISISPCPIREAVAEVRFEPNVHADAVFGIVYQVLKNEFPAAEELPIVSVPAHIRNADKDLAFQPHYRLTSESSTALVGPKVIAIGTRGAYPGWQSLSTRVSQVLRQFDQTGIVKQTVRLGLRYISFFPFDIYPKLELKICVNDESWDGEETFFKTIFNRSGCRSLLQVGKGMVLVGKPDEVGSVIDIDSFTTEIDGDFLVILDRFLESAHKSEKQLFFTLLKPDFLETLNPVYDNAE